LEEALLAVTVMFAEEWRRMPWKAFEETLLAVSLTLAEV